MRYFKRVAAFYLALVPGLESIRVGLDQARQRYPGLVIREYFHPQTADAIREGIYCDPAERRSDVPVLGLGGVYAVALADAECQYVLTGMKRVDSAWRRNFLTWFNPDHIVHPIFGWRHADVYAYLKTQRIGTPPASDPKGAGIDLSTETLEWLYDTYPQDFRRICDFFPYAESVIWRRQWFNEIRGPNQ